MNFRAQQEPLTMSIAGVERDTGLAKDTLRVWERRYGFPQPGRDAFGERAYSLAEVESCASSKDCSTKATAQGASWLCRLKSCSA